MGIRARAVISLIALVLTRTGALAEDALPPLACEGSKPDWQLLLHADSARFTFGKTLDMTIPQRTQVENAPFPKALTLLAHRDTAIVILNERRCDTEHATAFPIEANILTQKGEEPVILRGCCTVAE